MTHQQTRFYRLVGYSIFMLMVGTNLPTPLYGVYKVKWGFSSTTLTLLFAVYALMIIPSLLLFGQLSDKIGRKRVLVPGLLVSVIGSLLFACANSLTLLFIARAIQGLSVGVLSGAATAALAELHPTQDRRQAALVASLATAGGTAIGPFIAGLLAQYGPWPTVLPYALHIVLVVPAVIGLMGMNGSSQHEATDGSKRGILRVQRPSVPAEIRGTFMLAGATAFVAWAVTALYMSLVPSFVATMLHVHNLAVAGGVVFLMLACSSTIQVVMRKLPSHTAMIVGLLLLAGGLTAVVGSVPNDSFSLLLLGTVVAGFGQGLAFMGSMALVNQAAPANRRADVASSFYVVIYLGVGIPIIGTGLMAQSSGLYQAVLIFAWAVGIVAVCLAAAVAVRSRRTSSLSKSSTLTN